MNKKQRRRKRLSLSSLSLPRSPLISELMKTFIPPLLLSLSLSTIHPSVHSFLLTTFPPSSPSFPMNSPPSLPFPPGHLQSFLHPSSLLFIFSFDLFLHVFPLLPFPPSPPTLHILPHFSFISHLSSLFVLFPFFATLFLLISSLFPSLLSHSPPSFVSLLFPFLTPVSSSSLSFIHPFLRASYSPSFITPSLFLSMTSSLLPC